MIMKIAFDNHIWIELSERDNSSYIKTTSINKFSVYILFKGSLYWTLINEQPLTKQKKTLKHKLQC